MEVLNYSHAITSLCIIHLHPCAYSCIQELLVPLITAMGQDAMILWLEVTSVSATKDGGELGVTIQERVIVSLKIVAEIPTYVIIMGSAFGMKLYSRTVLAVCVILVGNYLITVSVPRERSFVSSMRAPRIHSVQSTVFVTTYLETIQRLESMRVSTTTVHVMEVSYDTS